MKSAMIYLKTTETCQLDCSHCFTSGSLGRKIYFDVDKTIDWFRRLKNGIPEIKDIHDYLKRILKEILQEDIPIKAYLQVFPR